MPSEDIKKVRELLSAMPDSSKLSIEEMRAQLDRLADLFSLSDDFSVEKIGKQACGTYFWGRCRIIQVDI